MSEQGDGSNGEVAEGSGADLDEVIAQLERIRALQPSRKLRLVIRGNNAGGLSAHQTTEVQGIYAGFDWEAGMVIVEPAKPLTELKPDQVADISKSVRAGTSWHAYQRDAKLRQRITALEAEVALFRGQTAADGKPAAPAES